MPQPYIQAVVFDFSRVLLFPRDKNYQGGLNALHKSLAGDGQVHPFFEHFQLNEELLQFLSSIKDVPLYIFTSGSVQESVALQATLLSVFKAIYSAESLGVSKSNPNAYKRLSQTIEMSPENILFIDDQIINLEAAQKAGLRTHQFTSNDKVEELLRNQNLV